LGFLKKNRFFSILSPTHVMVKEEKCQVAVKIWNSLSTCFYDLVSSIQKEKFFTPILLFLWAIQFRHIWHLRYI